MRSPQPLVAPVAALTLIAIVASTVPAQLPFPREGQAPPYRPDAYQPFQRPLPQLYPPNRPAEFRPVYRLASLSTGDHVYTTELREVRQLTRQATHQYEGVVFYTYEQPFVGAQPLYRFVRADGKHFLDTRRRSAIDPYAREEAVLGYVSVEPSRGLRPLSIWVSDANLLWFYTTNRQGELARQSSYTYRGILGYVVPADEPREHRQEMAIPGP